MQSTFSATSDHCSVQLDSEGEITEGEEGGGGEGEREGETVQVNTIHVSEVAPAPQSSEVNSAAFSELKLTKSYSPWELSGAKIGRNYNNYYVTVKVCKCLKAHVYSIRKSLFLFTPCCVSHDSQ